MFIDETEGDRVFGILEQFRNQFKDTSQVDLWIKRGWEESLRYYSWSRSIEYADGVDQDGAKRLRLIELYQLDAPVPERERHRTFFLLDPPTQLTRQQYLRGLQVRRSVRKFTGEISSNQLSTVINEGWKIAGFSLESNVSYPLGFFQGAPGVFSLGVAFTTSPT